ncbi:MAG: YceH family protein [Thermoanaerobaculia bacterium]
MLTDDAPPARLPRLLDPVEIRVLGALLEKQQATPEYYPLTLNALVAACNQKSNRDPVTDLSAADVTAALDHLRKLVFVWKVGGSRAERWEQNVERVWRLDAPTKAAMTLLLLRGPQTPGELRARSERLHAFAALDEVESALAKLAEGLEPLVAELPRAPGQKEARWTHLAGGPVGDAAAPATPALAAPADPDPLESRVTLLEEQVAALSRELWDLKKRLGEG